MITIEETGLSAGDYNLLKDARSNAVYEVIAHRYNLKFDVDVPSSHSNNGTDFDAVVFNDVVYRIAGTFVERFASGAATGWTPVTGFPITGIAGDFPHSLVGNATGLVVFTTTLDGVQNTYYNTVSWSSPQVIDTTANIRFIAATSAYRLHYVVFDTSKYLWNLRVLEFNGSTWESTASDIWWQFPIESFDATALGDTDVIVMATNTPGLVKVQHVNNQVTKTISPSGGIVAFTYKNGSWSDHYDVEVLDEVASWRNRYKVRISTIGDTAYLTTYSVDGTQKYNFNTNRVYLTKNGRNWQRGEALPVTAYEYGMILLRSGDYAYLVQRSNILRSYSTLFTGHSSDAVQLDITKYIRSFSVNRRDMQQVFCTLTNVGNWIANSILDGTNTVWMVIKNGYWVDNPPTKAIVQTGLLQVDSIEKSKRLPTREVKITARDLLSRMATRTQSEEFKAWSPQFLGADNFKDYTGTGFGGMSHTRPVVGTWKSISNSLQIVTSNKESIAFSVFDSAELWNGASEVAFMLSELANDEFAGIVFRAQDKDNLDYVKYSQTDDKLQYYQRRSGLDKLIEESSTLNWSSSLDTRFIRVEFRYARVNVYSSEDGVTWALAFSTLSSGQSGIIPLLPTGYVGQIGKGFSDLDVWSSDPGPIGEGGLAPYLKPAGTLHGTAANIGMLLTDGILYTNDFTSSSPTWQFEDWAAFHPTNNPDGLNLLNANEIVYGIVQKPGEPRTFVLATTTHVRVFKDVLNGTHETLSYPLRSTVSGQIARLRRRVQIERGNPNICYVVTQYTDGLWSEGFINDSPITPVQIGGSVDAGAAPALFVDQNNPLIAYLIAYDGSIWRWYKTADGGQSWNITSDYAWDNTRPIGSAERSFGNPSRIFVATQTSAGLGAYQESLRRATASGVDVIRTDGAGWKVRSVATYDSDPNVLLFVSSAVGSFSNYERSIVKSLDGGNSWTTILASEAMCCIGNTTTYVASSAVIGGDGSVFLWLTHDNEGVYFHPNIYTLTDFSQMQDKTGSGYTSSNNTPYGLVGL